MGPGCCLSPCCVGCQGAQLPPAPTHCGSPFVLCNAQSGCCYIPPPNSRVNTELLQTPFNLTLSCTPRKSTLPSLASLIIWTPKLHCLLHGASCALQTQPHPFFSFFSFVHVLHCHHKTNICLPRCGSAGWPLC